MVLVWMWHFPCFGQTSGDVTGVGTLSARTILIHEQLRFTLTLRNKTGSPLSSLTLLVGPDGYQVQQVCVPDSEWESKCWNGWDLSHSGLELAPALPPGQSLTVWGYLRPTNTHKTAMVTVVLAWKPSNAPKVAYSSATFSLGENLVQSEINSRLVWLYDFFGKVLAIPMLLVLIGWGLDQISKRREERRDQQQEKALRAETWKQMLPVSHSYSAKYYLPLSLAAEKFVHALRTNKIRVAFFHLLQLQARMRVTRDEIGGFYFRDLRGETLAAECWRRQSVAILGSEDSPFQKAMSAIMAKVQTSDSYQDFEDRFSGVANTGSGFSDVAVETAWKLFQGWTNNQIAVSEAAESLDGFIAVLDFESNRPFEYWYDTRPRLVATKRLESMLRTILQSEHYTSEQVAQYFSAVTQI